MSEDRLKALLREEPLPGAAEAERRGLALVSQAYAERRAPAKPVLPRLAVALAAFTLLAALLLTPAGAAVRNWIDDVFTAGVRHAEPALTEVPGGGKLLVSSPRGPWVVQADGSRRLLGDYAEASWSPHGLFVVTASGRTLSALEPDGTPHWSISAPARVADPRWSPSGFRIAYRAGRSLRVVRANGTGDAAVGPSAAVPPAWLPSGPHLLAYVNAKQRLVVAEADGGRTIDSAAATPGAIGLSWSRNGGELLEVTRRGAWGSRSADRQARRRPSTRPRGASPTPGQRRRPRRGVPAARRRGRGPARALAQDRHAAQRSDPDLPGRRSLEAAVHGLGATRPARLVA